MASGMQRRLREPSINLRSRDNLTGAVHRAVDRTFFIAGYALALLMVAFACLQILLYLSYDMLPPLNYTLGYIMLIACGAIILTVGKRNMVSTIGLYAIGLGSYRVLTTMTSIVPGSVFTFFSIAVVLLGFNMLITGISYLRGVSRARITMMASAALLASFYLGTFLYSIYKGAPAWTALKGNLSLVVNAIMYVVLFYILDSDIIRERDRMEIHNDVLDRIRCTYCTDPDSCIAQADARVLSKAFSDRSSWTPLTDGGPAECEYSFSIRNGEETSHVLLQKWVDSERIHVTVTDHPGGALITAYRFSVDDVVYDRTSFAWVRLIGGNGHCVHLRVEGSEGAGQ